MHLLLVTVYLFFYCIIYVKKKHIFYFCLFNLSPSSLLEILTAINDVYVFTESDVPFRVIAYLGRAHTRAPAKIEAEVS